MAAHKETATRRPGSSLWPQCPLRGASQGPSWVRRVLHQARQGKEGNLGVVISNQGQAAAGALAAKRPGCQRCSELRWRRVVGAGFGGRESHLIPPHSEGSLGLWG